jgi:hypothetical protein
LPRLQQNWEQRTQRPLPDSVKFAQRNFERIWIADGSTLEALFRKLKSLEDLKTGQLAGKIFTVIDLVTRLPVEVWFHTKPSASETNFEAALLSPARYLGFRCADPGLTFCFLGQQQLYEINLCFCQFFDLFQLKLAIATLKFLSLKLTL